MKKTSDKNDSVNMLTIKHFWAIMRQYRKELSLASLIVVQTICTGTLVPFYIGKILGALGTPGSDASQYFAPFIGIALLGIVSNYLGFKGLFELQPKVMRYLEHEALESLLKRSVGFHNNRVSGKLVTDATQYSSSYGQLCDALFVNVVPFALTIILGTSVVLAHSLLLGSVVLLMTVSVVAVALWQTISNNDRREQRHDSRRKMVAHMADTITNSQSVTIFAQASKELKTHSNLSNQLMNFRTRDWGKIASDGSKRIAVLTGFQITFIVLIVYLVERDPTLLAIGIFTFSYAINLSARLFEIGNLFRRIEDALMDASDMTRIVHGTAEVLDAPRAGDLQVHNGTVAFNDVRFYYSDAQEDDTVFDGLNLKIPAGQKVGLVGPSGGGKSTLSRLLLRFEDIQAGSITIDGQSIADVTQQSLRQAISYVPQEPLLFHRTIAENIAYGKLNATDDEIMAAARQAYAFDFIQKLPKGFDTVVGERGVKLSGGQRQRIAIARAILKNAPILVLDEATSALDSESEATIQLSLTKLMEGRTTLVIAHRLSTIQRLDRIIVLEDGVIKEDSTHKQLLANKKLYALLWKHQSGGFIEE